METSCNKPVNESNQIHKSSARLIITAIDAKPLWNSYKELFTISNQLLRKGGRLIIFSEGEKTAYLITNAIRDLPFGYRAVWQKGFSEIRHEMVSCFEDILIFSLKEDYNKSHLLRQYFGEVLKFINLSQLQINQKIGNRSAEHCFYVKSTQFEFCTEHTYDKLIEIFHINKMVGFKTYEELRIINTAFNNEFNSVFNLWEGYKTKGNILNYQSEQNSVYKPVLLFEDLIKTFSNQDDLIIDFMMYDNNLKQACHNTCRRFEIVKENEIGI